MIDVNVLRGASVRDNAGTRGEVLGLSLPWVRMCWWDEEGKPPREEALLRSDPRMSSIDILTLSKGWIPVSDILGAKKKASPPSVAEDLEDLVQEASGGKPHSPFKTAREIGPGPRYGWPHGGKWRKKKHVKRSYWDCDCSGYRCKCKGKGGENKTVNIKKGWKKTYNALYKAWRKTRLDVAAPSRITRRQAKKK